MTNFMDDPGRGFAQHYQSASPLSTSHTISTSATSGELVTPLEPYNLRHSQTSYDSQFDISPTSESYNKEQYKGLADDYFLNEFVLPEPLTSKRNLDGVQNGQSSFDSSNVYEYQEYQPQTNGNWSASPSVTTSPPIRKLHDYSSRKSSVQTNSNLSYTSSSTPASQFDRFLALTPLSTPSDPGSYQPSSQGFSFYPKDMSSTQTTSMSEEPQWVSPSLSRSFESPKTIDRFSLILKIKLLEICH